MRARDHDGPSWVDQALNCARTLTGIDHVEVRFEEQRDRRYLLRGQQPRTAGRGYIGGIGIRVRHGRGHGYAHTNQLDTQAVRTTVKRAHDLALADHRHATIGKRWEDPVPRRIHDHSDGQSGADAADAEHVHDMLARSRDALLERRSAARVAVAYGVKSTHTLFADDKGTWIDLGNATSTLYLQAVERDAGRTGDATTWRGGSLSLQDYERDGGPEAIGAEAADRLAESLVARPVAPGRHRTLTDPNLSGLLAHESFGHLTESDLVRSGWSVLQGRIGERLAAADVTIRDTPLAPDPKTGVRVPYDSEGSPGGPVTLLENGVLRDYMHDRTSAQEMDHTLTGNARALHIGHPPIVRMRNTYIEGGDLDLDETIEQLQDGYYLLGGRGGSPRADGSFMFTADRGYRVENGQIVHPVKMCSIYGNVLDFLQNVEGLTRDIEMHTNYFGGCGKWDQSFLHVGTGGPHVLVREALLGGQTG